MSINPIQERQHLRSVKWCLDQIPHVLLDMKVSWSRLRKLRKKKKKETASFTSECLFLSSREEMKLRCKFQMRGT